MDLRSTFSFFHKRKQTRTRDQSRKGSNRRRRMHTGKNRTGRPQLHAVLVRNDGRGGHAGPGVPGNSADERVLRRRGVHNRAEGEGHRIAVGGSGGGGCARIGKEVDARGRRPGGRALADVRGRNRDGMHPGGPLEGPQPLEFAKSERPTDAGRKELRSRVQRRCERVTRGIGRQRRTLVARQRIEDRSEATARYTATARSKKPKSASVVHSETTRRWRPVRKSNAEPTGSRRSRATAPTSEDDRF